MTEFATLVLAAETNGLVNAETRLKAVSGAAAQAESRTDRLGRSMRALSGVAGTLAGTLAAAFSLRAIGSAAEQYTKMTNSLRALGLTAGEAEVALSRVADIALATRAPLQATAQLYTRISIAAGELGASQQDVLRFTENVGLALGAAGIGANEASGALMQLSQAMAGGTVRAEEFNSILENAFPLAQAAARGIDEAGGSVGRLRQLVIDGQISSEEFFRAILSQSDALAASFASTQITVGGALTQLNVEFTMLVGSLDQMMGVSAAAAAGISFLAENLQLIASVGAAAVAVLVGAYIPAIVAGTVATAGFVASLITLRGALLATGIGALVVGAGLMIDFLLRLRTATGSWGAALQALGDVAAGVWSGIKGSAQALVPALGAVWQEIQAGFYIVLENMAAAWSSFLAGVAGAVGSIPGGSVLGGPLLDAAERAEQATLGFATTANDALAAAYGLRAEAQALATQGFDEAREAAGRLNEIMTGNVATTTEAEDSARFLAGTLGDVEGAAGDAGGAVEGLGDKAKDAVPELQSLADVMKEQATQGVDSLASAFGDFIAGGLKDFKGFATSIIDTFKGMISQLIATAVGNPIKIALGLGVAPGTALAGGGAPGGGAGALGQLGGLGGAFGTGLSSVFAGLTSGGLSGAFGAVGTALSGATASLTGFATAVGALALPVAAVAGLFSFFRTKTRTLDSGLRVTIDGVAALAETFEVIEKKKFWGLSRKVRESFSAADAELQAAVTDTYQTLRGSVLDMGKVLGFGAQSLSDFTAQIKLSTAGMTQEDAQKAVLAEFERLGVDMASHLFGSFTETVVDSNLIASLERQLSSLGGGRDDSAGENWARDRERRELAAQLAAARAGRQVTHLNRAFERLKLVGEDNLQLLTRLSSGFLAANEAMRALGHTVFETSTAGIAASAALVRAMGGLEQFQKGVDFYFSNFYSVTEQAQFAAQQLRRSFRDMNINGGQLPRTMEQFRGVVDRLLAAGRVWAAGQLINLAPAFAEMLRLREQVRGLGEEAEETSDALERQRDRARRRGEEREELERRLLELQGNTAELRRRELAALWPANRALQRMIWGIEDARAAMEALDENDFATLLDFRVAQGHAASAQPRNGAMFAPAPARPEERASPTRDAGVRQELTQLRSEMAQLLTTVASSTRQTMQLVRKWDNIGMPLEQAP